LGNTCNLLETELIFKKTFKVISDEIWVSINIAGSYLIIWIYSTGQNIPCATELTREKTKVTVHKQVKQDDWKMSWFGIHMGGFSTQAFVLREKSDFALIQVGCIYAESMPVVY
jgi:hypothetical protein